MTPRKPDWSTLYATPVYRLLYLCGLKRLDLVSTADGRAVWEIRREPDHESE